jgi:single-strand DNA-binding protein
MANLAILRGNIGSMEDIKQVGGDNSLLKFTLATTKRIKGEDKTTWHRCLVWGKTAEIIAQYFSKGSQIYVQGEIENGSYDDKDGKKVYTSEIVVREFDFCGSKSDSQGQQSNQNTQQNSQQSQGSWGSSNNQNQNQNNNQNQRQNNQQQNNNGGQHNFNNPPFNPDDDIPFNQG